MFANCCCSSLQREQWWIEVCVRKKSWKFPAKFFHLKKLQSNFTKKETFIRFLKIKIELKFFLWKSTRIGKEISREEQAWSKLEPLESEPRLGLWKWSPDFTYEPANSSDPTWWSRLKELGGCTFLSPSCVYYGEIPHILYKISLPFLINLLSSYPL